MPTAQDRHCAATYAQGVLRWPVMLTTNVLLAPITSSRHIGNRPESHAYCDLSWPRCLSCNDFPASVSSVERRNAPNARTKPASSTGQPKATTNAAVARKLTRRTTNCIRISEVALIHRQAGPRQFACPVLLEDPM